MESLVNLFENEATRFAAAALASLSFVAGVLAACIACWLVRCCRSLCSCKCGEKTRERQKSVQRRPDLPAGTVEIYVGNLSYDLTEDVLRKEFEAYGKVTSARIITNRYNGRSKGFGFVHMTDASEAAAAVKALNNKLVLGRNIKCNQAKLT